MARTGKIARLPAAIRERLNRRLYDGADGPDLLSWLNAMPAVQRVMKGLFDGLPIGPQNLTEWRQGGYTDWLSERKRIDQVKDLSRFALELTRAQGLSMSDGASAIAAGKLYEFLESAGYDRMIELVPGLARLRKADADMLKARTDKERLPLQRRQVAVIEGKYQRETCALFIKWAEDQRARDIAGSAEPHAVKIDRLRELMFGPVKAPEA
jgi:hypothetical protein